MVINGESGYARDNSSWILGRIVRDYEHWMHSAVHDKTNAVLREEHNRLRERRADAKPPPRAGLVVSIYEPSPTLDTGKVVRDNIYWCGVPIMLLQLGIAAIPCGIYGDWGILTITAAGTILSIATGLLPQWKKEKWACRPNSDHHYILTRGNGAQHVIVVLGTGRGYNLEDLASGQGNIQVSTNRPTRVALLVLSFLWILLLITAAGLRANTWFLLAVGGVGMLQNIFVAGWPRRPENFGIPLEYVTTIGNRKVMKTLFELEEGLDTRLWGLGCAMLNEFFPGDLPIEDMKWNGYKERAKRRRHEAQGVHQTPQKSNTL